MKIAILGGTGSIGGGLAYRWAENHEIFVGSRDAEKAEKAAYEYACLLSDRGISCNIFGLDNKTATARAEVVVISIPHAFVVPFLGSLYPSFKDQTVISLVVPIKKNTWYEYTPPRQGSAALEIRDLLPPGVTVVSAYHNIPARKLCNLDIILEGDVVVCGDVDNAKRIVMDLTREIRNLRPLDGGPLTSSSMIESLTPFLMNLGIRNNLSDLSVKFI